jgi:hypothetical protein
MDEIESALEALESGYELRVRCEETVLREFVVCDSMVVEGKPRVRGKTDNSIYVIEYDLKQGEYVVYDNIQDADLGKVDALMFMN